MNSVKVEQTGQFRGRVGIIQRVLPAYRAQFFKALSLACRGGVSVFAGKPRPDESIGAMDRLSGAEFVQAKNWELFHPHAAPYFLWQGGLIKWLRSWDPDVLVLEANARYLSTRMARRWMHKRRRPVIGWGLGVPLLDPAGRESGFMASIQESTWRKFLLSFDALISYSRMGAQQYRLTGFPEDLVFVAPNAVAPRPREPLPYRPPEFQGRPKVLFVGRLQARKRIDDLVRACAALPDEIQPELWIIGDGPARVQFQSIAEQNYPRATFFGAVRGEELKPYFAQADLFVLPGTGGLAVQEAMASGLPVVVAEGDGTQADMVRTSKGGRPGNGWLVPQNQAGALEQTLRTALSNVERLREMGAESYRIAAEEYNLENMVKVFLRALSAVDK